MYTSLIFLDVALRVCSAVAVISPFSFLAISKKKPSFLQLLNPFFLETVRSLINTLVDSVIYQLLFSP